MLRVALLVRASASLAMAEVQVESEPTGTRREDWNQPA